MVPGVGKKTVYKQKGTVYAAADFKCFLFDQKVFFAGLYWFQKEKLGPASELL